VAAKSCLSTRQFERQARIRLGLPPKLYARIVRFFFAFRLKRKRPDLTWTAISNTCGYFDQMHFIRDFKAFAGATPRMLRGREVRPSRRKLAWSVHNRYRICCLPFLHAKCRVRTMLVRDVWEFALDLTKKNL
jgi:AraC-like DNA-binding protein